MTKTIFITKANGETEAFNSLKLIDSLERVGASKQVIVEIEENVSSELVEGMSTKEIYRKAFSLLRDKEKKPIAAKYSLRNAVFGLGPSGFPFEEFVAEIYRAMGHNASTDVMLQGKCVEHEVDLLAIKEGRKHGAEIKFHNHQGIKTDLKVALYVQARFDDLIKNKKVDEGILITNTKFTSNAIAYGECVGLKMISWDYPSGENLYSLIEQTGLHPITCLTTIGDQDKKRLIENKIVLCRSIKKNTDVLKTHGISADRIPIILNEVNALCQPRAGV